MGGGKTTPGLAEAAPPMIPTKLPVPSSKLAVMLLVVLFLTPEMVPTTSTDSVQLEEPGRVNATRLMSLLPGLTTTSAVARQLPATLLGEATTSPLGSTSSNDVLTRFVVEFGLSSVKASEVVPFSVILAAAKLWANVGGATTGPLVPSRRADAADD